MKIQIDPAVFEKFNGFTVGIIFCQINNTEHSDDIYEMLRDIEEYVRISFNKNALISTSKAAQQLGLKHYHTRVEMLMETVLKGKEIPNKDTLTNLCNFIALKHLVPVGALDARNLGNLLFTIDNGELVLKDKKVVSRQLLYEADPSVEVSKKTQTALVLVETLPPVDAGKMVHVVDELADLIKIFCGRVQKKVLSEKQPTWNTR